MVCECKNESSRVSTREVQNFAELIRMKSNTPLGILFARKPLSGTRKDDAILAQRELALKASIYVINVNYEDLKAVARGGNFFTLLRDKYLSVAMDCLRSSPICLPDPVDGGLGATSQGVS